MLLLTIVILLAGPQAHLRKGHQCPAPRSLWHTDPRHLDDSYMLFFA